jgi:hypothetical protein
MAAVNWQNELVEQPEQIIETHRLLYCFDVYSYYYKFDQYISELAFDDLAIRGHRNLIEQHIEEYYTDYNEFTGTSTKCKNKLPNAIVEIFYLIAKINAEFYKKRQVDCIFRIIFGKNAKKYNRKKRFQLSYILIYSLWFDNITLITDKDTITINQNEIIEKNFTKKIAKLDLMSRKKIIHAYRKNHDILEINFNIKKEYSLFEKLFRCF